MYQQLIAIFNLVKSKTVKIYSVVQSVKLLLALSKVAISTSFDQ